jgi:retinol dehydrogenase-12
MQGKVCVVTGATSGIGEVCARELLARGARVLIVGRNPAKMEAACARIRAQTGREVEPLLADLSLQREIRRLSDEILTRTDRLDVLVNNAGAVFKRRELTAEGFEQTWAVNHLAYFLLTGLLRERLLATPAARIINVSSTGHKAARFDFNNLQSEKHHQIMEAYARTKLANVLFTFALARRLKGTGLSANCLHPGVVATPIWDKAPLWSQPILKFWQLFMISPEKGAETMIALATQPDLPTGRYFERCRPVASSRLSCDQALQEKLWTLSTQMTGLPDWNLP